MKTSSSSVNENEQLRRRVAELEAELARQRVTARTEEEYRYALELNPQVSWMANSRGGIEDFNQRWLDLTGLNREQALEDGWVQVVHPDDRPMMIATWMRSVRTGEPYDIEHRILVPGTGYRWMRSRAVPRRDSRGDIARWYGATEDINDRKEVELLLRNTEQSFSAAFAEAPIGMVLLSPEGKLLEVNRAYWQMLGYDSERLTGDSSAGFTHPDDIEKTREFFEILRMAKTDKAVLEKRYIHREGHTIWTRASATMRRDTQGRPMQVVAIVEDITEHKLAERVLRESEERLQLIFAQAPVGVCVLRGRDLVYELVNPHYQEILPNRELLGRPLLEAVPEAGTTVLNILYGVLDTGEPFTGTEFLIPLDQDRDGIVEDCWFNFVYHPLLDREGHVSGVVAIAIDVSSHVRAREELQRANRELEEFAYVSSHDLHEPLRMVNIYTELLMEDLEPLLTGKTVGYAEQVRRGVQRMERLLHDLLNFSRTIAAESLPDQPESMADLNVSLRVALQTMQGRIEEAGASLSFGSLPIVYGDQAQFAQVFQNLISNALK